MVNGGDGPNPSGLCMCGCGRRTPLASKTSRARGRVKGLPVRYLPGHGSRRLSEADVRAILSADPGTATVWAIQTGEAWGSVAAEVPRTPKRLRYRHTNADDVPPNPSGLCLCGCGERTRIAETTIRARGWVRGEPISYLPNHHPVTRSGLSAAEVRAVLLAGATESPRSIAERFGLEEANIVDILRGRSRRDVSPEIPRPLRKATGLPD